MNDQYFFKIKQIYLCYNLILKKIIIYDKLSKILKKTKCITYIYNKINNINENIISFKKNFYLEYNEIYIIKIIENSIKKINKIKKIIIYKLFYFFLKYEKNNKKIHNIAIMEIRAASGGKESCIFVKDLFKMYTKFFEKKKIKYKIIKTNINESGGFKEIITKLNGNNIYSTIKYESGIHRVQRIPITENQGRVHTSTCTVAILKKKKKIKYIKLNLNEIKIDTFKSSGAGGQHVNKTNSAIRITHIPSNISVECQRERSQHKNKNFALFILKNKLLSKKRNKQKQKIDYLRKKMIKKGQRSDKIRTYNYIQNRLTDHRINISINNLNNILNGQLDIILKYFKC